MALGDGQDGVRAGKQDEDSHSSNRPKHLPMALAILLFKDPRDHGFLGLGNEMRDRYAATVIEHATTTVENSAQIQVRNQVQNTMNRGKQCVRSWAV